MDIFEVLFPIITLFLGYLLKTFTALLTIKKNDRKDFH